MYRPIVILILLSLLAACAPPDSSPQPEATLAQTSGSLPQPTDAPAITILAFGDSLTAGFGVDDADSYPAQLEGRLRADGYDAEVINGGISGETSSAALARVDWMLATRPDIVIVETGANDALRGVDLELTRENIFQIVQKFTDSGAVVIVAGMQIVQNLGDEYVNDFAAIYPAVAEQQGAILIPFVLEGVAADPELNQQDFIHPNAAGYTVMVEHIYPFVLEAIDRLPE